MSKVDISNPINISKLHLEIKEKIFEDIRNRRIFGKTPTDKLNATL